jgi:hypothetical protein
VLTEKGGIIADPLFVNYTGNDFHLLKNSPCINMGVNLDCKYDLDGNKIRKKATIGCYEVPKAKEK